MPNSSANLIRCRCCTEPRRRVLPGDRGAGFFLHVSEPRLNQRLLLLRQRIVLVKPAVAVQFREFDTNLLPLFPCELGKLLQNLSFAHEQTLISGTAFVRPIVDPKAPSCGAGCHSSVSP